MLGRPAAATCRPGTARSTTRGHAAVTPSSDLDPARSAGRAHRLAPAAAAGRAGDRHRRLLVRARGRTEWSTTRGPVRGVLRPVGAREPARVALLRHRADRRALRRGRILPGDGGVARGGSSRGLHHRHDARNPADPGCRRRCRGRPVGICSTPASRPATSMPSRGANSSTSATPTGTGGPCRHSRRGPAAERIVHAVWRPARSPAPGAPFSTAPCQEPPQPAVDGQTVFRWYTLRVCVMFDARPSARRQPMTMALEVASRPARKATCTA